MKPLLLLARTLFRGNLPRRFAKFCTVGASGVLVNLSLLYLGQEWIFRVISVPAWRFNAALGLAIFFATLNNFFWNWAWTWRDRKDCAGRPQLMQFGQYVFACGLGIAIQVVLTKVLATYCHYLLANLSAIAVASLANFAANDRLTFRLPKSWRLQGRAA